MLNAHQEKSLTKQQITKIDDVKKVDNTLESSEDGEIKDIVQAGHSRFHGTRPYVRNLKYGIFCKSKLEVI